MMNKKKIIYKYIYKYTQPNNITKINHCESVDRKYLRNYSDV